MLNAAFFLFTSLIISYSNVSALSGYLFNQETSLSHPLNHQTDDTLNANNNCQIKVQSISSTSHVVYSGNAFTYDIGCSVTDASLQIGDKYYVIDLVVYGQNTRVAKAWRQQFSSSTSTGTGQISLDKNMSFYYLGASSIVCSVSKYNSFTNKFSKICQTNEKLTVKENPNLPSRQTPVVFKSVRPLSAATTQTTTAVETTVKTVSENVFRPDNIEESTHTEGLGDKKLDNIDNTSDEILNVRAMQYRDLFKAADKSKLISFLASEKEVSRSKRAIIQPIILAFLFVFIFCLSIGTVAYLTYNQRVTQAYQTVSTKQSETADDVTLRKFNKRPKSVAVVVEGELIVDRQATNA